MTLPENPSAKISALVYRNMKPFLKKVRNSFFVSMILTHWFIISVCLGSSIKRKTEFQLQFLNFSSKTF